MSSDSSVVPKIFIAIKCYDAKENDELSFKKNDLMTAHYDQIIDGFWMWGNLLTTNQRKEGFFHINYVTQFNDTKMNESLNFSKQLLSDKQISLIISNWYNKKVQISSDINNLIILFVGTKDLPLLILKLLDLLLSNNCNIVNSKIIVIVFKFLISSNIVN
eukprot:503227_1